MARWYSRPVWFVADVAATLDFYVGKLGFTEAWRHDHEDKTVAAQVNRLGCEICFSDQWPEKNGTGMLFLSLNRQDYDPLREELESKGVTVEDGWWGYDCMVVTDPDGNQLYFAEPGEDA